MPRYAFKCDSAGSPPSANKDCLVRALSIAASIPYDEAHIALEKAGRKPDRGAPPKVFVPVFTAYGFLVKHTQPSSGRRWSACRSVYGEPYSRRINRLPTVAKVVPTLTRGRFIVITARHAFAVIDGVAHDTSQQLCGPRKRVESIFMLEDKEGT